MPWLRWEHDQHLEWIKQCRFQTLATITFFSQIFANKAKTIGWIFTFKLLYNTIIHFVKRTLAQKAPKSQLKSTQIDSKIEIEQFRGQLKSHKWQSVECSHIIIQSIKALHGNHEILAENSKLTTNLQNVKIIDMKQNQAKFRLRNEN